jgi:hypothetical protein
MGFPLKVIRKLPQTLKEECATPRKLLGLSVSTIHGSPVRVGERSRVESRGSTSSKSESGVVEYSSLSNVEIGRFLYAEKQGVKMCLIDEGIQIEVRDEQEENADLCTVETREPLSNVILESFAHFEKQDSEMVSIDEGMQIEVNDEHEEKAHLPRIDV